MLNRGSISDFQSFIRQRGSVFRGFLEWTGSYNQNARKHGR